MAQILGFDEEGMKKASGIIWKLGIGILLLFIILVVAIGLSV